MDIRAAFAVLCKRYVRVLHNVELEVFDRTLTSYEEKGIPVVQHPDFIRCEQLSSCLLVILRIVPTHHVGKSVGVGVDGLLSKKLTDVFVRCLLIAAKVNELVTISDDLFPLLLEKCLKLRQVLKYDAD